MVLRTLYSTLKDIPVSLFFIIVCLTVWRIPSIVKLFKTYQRGENEHVLFMKNVFGPWLLDIPFVFMALMTFISWRGPALLYHLIVDRPDDHNDQAKTEDDRDLDLVTLRRTFAFVYFGLVILDILAFLFCMDNNHFKFHMLIFMFYFILVLVILITVGRLPAVYSLFLDNLDEFAPFLFK